MKPSIALMIALLGAAPVMAKPERALRMVVIDVEGGGGTLYVTPEGRSLLVDAGWASGGDRPPSAGLIAATARRLGLRRIDYLMVSHYHADHVGGVADLIAAIPIGTVVDHGPNMEPSRPGAPPASTADGMFAAYEKAIAGKTRRIVKAGDRLKIGSMTVDIVNAATRVTPAPGRTGPASCATMDARVGATVNENDASIGVVVGFGKARTLNLADTTAAIERQLLCPNDRIGPIDLMVVSHHGSAQSNSPQLLAAIGPRVALLGNGATKGGDKAVLQALAAAPSRPEVWQSHGATRSPDLDVPAERIANPEGPADAHHALEALVFADGRMRVTNGRTAAAKDYPAR